MEQAIKPDHTLLSCHCSFSADVVDVDASHKQLKLSILLRRTPKVSAHPKLWQYGSLGGMEKFYLQP